MPEPPFEAAVMCTHGGARTWPTVSREAARRAAVIVGLALTVSGPATMTTKQAQVKAVQVKTGTGVVEGRISADGGARAFKGVPFAAPPVGELRWQAPRPVKPWTGVRPATDFGARCMQGPIFSDMIFRDGPSEDCLYLNVWTTAPPPRSRLPVMV